MINPDELNNPSQSNPLCISQHHHRGQVARGTVKPIDSPLDQHRSTPHRKPPRQTQPKPRHPTQRPHGPAANRTRSQRNPPVGARPPGKSTGSPAQIETRRDKAEREREESTEERRRGKERTAAPSPSCRIVTTPPREPATIPRFASIVVDANAAPPPLLSASAPSQPRSRLLRSTRPDASAH